MSRLRNSSIFCPVHSERRGTGHTSRLIDLDRLWRNEKRTLVDGSVIRKFARSPTQRGVLRNEAHVLEGLRHQSIPKLVELKESTTSTELVLQTLPGRPLAELVQQGVLINVDWRHVVRRVLAYLHENGLSHGDSKPANILIYSHGVYLIDFGASSPLDTKYDSIPYRCFSPPYAAWGQVTGRGAVSVEDDLYSLACTHFVATHRRHPFEMESIAGYFSRGVPTPVNLTSRFGERLARRILQQWRKACQTDTWEYSTKIQHHRWATHI